MIQLLMLCVVALLVTESRGAAAEPFSPIVEIEETVYTGSGSSG